MQMWTCCELNATKKCWVCVRGEKRIRGRQWCPRLDTNACALEIDVIPTVPGVPQILTGTGGGDERPFPATYCSVSVPCQLLFCFCSLPAATGRNTTRTQLSMQLSLHSATVAARSLSTPV